MRATALVLLGSSTTLVQSLGYNSTNSTTFQSSVPKSTRVQSDVHLGDLIAHGFGVAKESETASVAGLPLNTTVFAAAAPSAAIPTWTSNATHALGPLTSSAPNSSVNLDECWNSWSGYWDKLYEYGPYTPRDETVCLYTYAPTTISRTSTLTESWADIIPSTVVWTYTNVFDANGFAASTQYVLNTYTISGSSKGTTWTSVTTWDYTETESCYSTSTSKASMLPTPECALPTTQLPKCQALWETWLDHQLTPSVVRGTQTSYFQDYMAPSCTQASAGSALCTSLKDAYVSSRLDLEAFSRVLPSIDRYAYRSMSGGFYKVGPYDTWHWPSTAYFAPSCTLGCGRCSIEGGTVQLMYWPPMTSTAGANATLTGEKPFTVETLGTTFTSPTLYVSYQSLYATNGCGHKVGTPMYDQIIAIPTASTLSSVWARPLGGAVIFYNGPGVLTSTASLNITDLHEPVPMSIYSSQPFCASYAQANAAQFELNSWDCPRDSPYKPVIKLPHDLLQGLDPAWAECAEAYGGVYDPPIALRPADAIAVPTRPASNGEPTSNPAAEPSRPRPTMAEPTRAASQVAEPVGSIKTSASAGVHGSGNPTPTRVSKESPRSSNRTPASVEDHNFGNSPDGTSASEGVHNAGDFTLGNPSKESPKFSEGPQTGQAIAPTDSHDQSGKLPQNGQKDKGDHSVSNDLAATKNTQPSIGGASPTGTNPDNEVDSDSVPNRPAGNNAISIIESALHAAISQIRPQQSSQPRVSEGVSQPPNQQTPGPAGHNDATPATRPVNPSGVLHISSDVFNQLPAKSGAVVFANAHSTITLSPGGPIVNIGSHFVSAAASNVFIVGSGSNQITTSLYPPGVSAVDGQSPAGAASSIVGAGSVYSNAKPTSLPEEEALTIGDQVLTAAVVNGGLIYANAETTVTFKPGRFPASVAGVKLNEAASGRLVVGTGSNAATVALPTRPYASNVDSNDLDQGALTIGDQILSAASSDGALIYVNSITTVTLKPGHFPASVGGVQLSEVAPGRLVIGTGSDARTVVLPRNAEALTIGTHVFTPVKTQTGVYANAETTISLGRDSSATTIGGIRVGQAAGGRVVVGTGSDARTLVLPTKAEAFTIGTHVLTPVATQTDTVYADAETTVSLGLHGAVTTIDGIRVSAVAAGSIVLGTGRDATTLALPTHDAALTIGTQVLTPIATRTGAVFANGKTTVSIGPVGSVTMIDGTRVSVAAAGVIVVGTGSDATTVTLPTPDNTLLTIGTEVLTPIAVQTAAVFADGNTTISIGPVGSVTTTDGVRVSVAASGVMVIGTGSDATTVTLAASGFASASRTTSKNTPFSTESASSMDSNSAQSTGDFASNTGTGDGDTAESAGNMQTSLGWVVASFAALLVMVFP